MTDQHHMLKLSYTFSTIPTSLCEIFVVCTQNKYFKLISETPYYYIISDAIIIKNTCKDQPHINITEIEVFLLKRMPKYEDPLF